MHKSPAGKTSLAEVLLERLDPFFIVRAVIVNVPNLLERQIEIGHIQAEPIVGQVLKESLAPGLRMAAYLFVHDDVPTRLGLGIGRLVPPYFNRDVGVDFHPILHSVNLVLPFGVSSRGDDAVMAPFFQDAVYFWCKSRYHHASEPLHPAIASSMISRMKSMQL
ncbi:hypothetical protein [Prosthecobacter algae]|uniref:hypothetical protein n=1 Tax=Prosthecobacter algae TaxID=1144682 RepID=UPI0031E63696